MPGPTKPVAANVAHSAGLVSRSARSSAAVTLSDDVAVGDRRRVRHLRIGDPRRRLHQAGDDAPQPLRRRDQREQVRVAALQLVDQRRQVRGQRREVTRARLEEGAVLRDAVVVEPDALQHGGEGGWIGDRRLEWLEDPDEEANDRPIQWLRWRRLHLPNGFGTGRSQPAAQRAHLVVDGADG